VNPFAHFLIVIGPLVCYSYLRERRLPSRHLFGLAFLASQFPDLVDKPLAHQFGLIPSGRVFMHSVPTALPLWLLVGVYAWRTERRRAGTVFMLGHLSHLLADHHNAFFGSSPRLPTELLWPLVSVPRRPLRPGWAGPGSINVRLWTLFSALVLAVTTYYLVRDVRTQVRRRRATR
jgi:membrane-bound metal-dependent hydrolase YbcI (DUF457 family)